jgi:hypothetical protein
VVSVGFATLGLTSADVDGAGTGVFATGREASGLAAAVGSDEAGFGAAATVCSVTSRIGSSETAVAARPAPADDVAAC